MKNRVHLFIEDTAVSKMGEAVCADLAEMLNQFSDFLDIYQLSRQPSCAMSTLLGAAFRSGCPDSSIDIVPMTRDAEGAIRNMRTRGLANGIWVAVVSSRFKFYPWEAIVVPDEFLGSTKWLAKLREKLIFHIAESAEADNSLRPVDYDRDEFTGLTGNPDWDAWLDLRIRFNSLFHGTVNLPMEGLTKEMADTAEPFLSALRGTVDKEKLDYRITKFEFRRNMLWIQSVGGNSTTQFHQESLVDALSPAPLGVFPVHE